MYKIWTYPQVCVQATGSLIRCEREVQLRLELDAAYLQQWGVSERGGERQPATGRPFRARGQAARVTTQHSTSTDRAVENSSRSGSSQRCPPSAAKRTWLLTQALTSVITRKHQPHAPVRIFKSEAPGFHTSEAEIAMHLASYA